MSESAAIDAAASAAADAPQPAGESSAPAEAPASAAAPPTGETSSDSVLDRELPDGMQKFDRSYVEQVRAEAAKNRVAAREAQDALNATKEKYAAFEQYDEADLQVWKSMATDWRANPAGAAATMRAIANNVLGDPTATTAEKVEAAQQLEAVDAAEQTGDTQDVEKIVEERLRQHDEKRELDQQVAAIEKQVTDAGYAKGTMQYNSVLWYAANDPEVGGDIGRAIDKMKAYDQSVIDGYVQSVAGGKQPPARVPGASEGQAGGTTGTAPRNVKEATAAARAFLEGRASA